MGAVVVKSTGSFRNEIHAGEHTLVTDEPVSAGGTGVGPTPYDLLSAALGSCTSMTLHFIAKRDGIPLTGVEVTITNDRLYAKDCADCLTTQGYIHRFDVRIKLEGDLTAEQREKLASVAKRCPVYKTLTNEIRIDETVM
ncbi:MAG: OsmC family protein [Acidobacteriota bacterium]